MCYSDSGYFTLYAVILFILASPGAQGETTTATNRLRLMMTPSLLDEHFNCYGSDMRGGLFLHTLLSGDRQSTLPVLEMISSGKVGGGGSR